MKKAKWTTTKYPGVRYREHATRKHGIMPDKYFAIRYQKDGKRKEEGLGWASSGWTDQKAAIELARLKEAATVGVGHISLAEKREAAEKKRIEKEALKETEKREAVTFGYFFNQVYFPYAKQVKGESSWMREEALYRLWVKPVVGHKPFKAITADIDLMRIKRNMEKAERAPRTIQYMLGFVRQVFNHAVSVSLYNGSNPATKIRKPKFDNKRSRFLSREEASLLLDALSTVSRQLYEMSIIALHCGLRAGEIFSLTWSDVDIQGGRLTVKDTKSGHNRTLPMSGAVKEVLSLKEKGNPGDLVFPTRQGGKKKYISTSFTRTTDRLFNQGVTDRRQRVTFHTLRHTFASWLVIGSISIYDVKKHLGHSTITMTERYAHLSPEKSDAIAQVFDRRVVPIRRKSANN